MEWVGQTRIPMEGNHRVRVFLIPCTPQLTVEGDSRRIRVLRATVESGTDK